MVMLLMMLMMALPGWTNITLCCPLKRYSRLPIANVALRPVWLVEPALSRTQSMLSRL